MIYIKNDRSVFPNNVKVSNQYENETRTIQFDLSDVQFTGNTYLICKYQNNQDFYAPLLLDSNFSIPVETFLSAQAGTYTCVIAISTATIDENYDFSTDNPLFVSNIFTLTVDANFLTGTSTSWQLTPAAQNYFDQLIALVEKVQSDLDSGAFVGNGIQSITKISTSGLVDTYQITFTNRSTFEYQVTNGQNGQTPTITIQDGYWYINGVNTGQQAQGDAGDNATIAIGTVTTLEPDQEATVQNTGTETNAVLSFGIPKGATGPQGPQGAPGVNENVLHADISKSENPSVDDAYEAPLQDLKLYGKSTQVSTTGKNLFDINNEDQYYSNVLLSHTDTEIVKNSRITPLLKIENLEVGTNYTISYHSETDGVINNGQLTYSLSTQNEQYPTGNFSSRVGNGTATYDNIITFEAPAETIYFIGSIKKETITQFQIERGASKTDYEPYTGGAPSPSPDYPQEITKIEEVDCLVTGAQLFDLQTVIDRSDTTHALTDTGLSVTGQYYVYTKGIVVEPNTDMYIYYEKTGDGANRVAIFDESDGLSNDNQITYFATNGGTFNTGNNNQIRLLFYCGFGTSSTSVYNNVMLNRGTQALPYEPYQSQHVQFTPPAPLYSLLDGSVADYVDIERGKYVYQLANTVFDGSYETWVKNGSADYTYHITLSDIAPEEVSDGNDILSDRFIAKRSNATLSSGEFRRGGGGVNNVLVFRYDGLSTDDLDGWKAFLQSNNVFVVYQLATPTEQDIPAETLEALQALKTFNGATNIFCNAPVSAQYEQSVQIVISKILEQLNSLQTQTLNLQEEMINNV